MNRQQLRIVPRFPRTAGDAFKDARYASPITIYTRPLWRRVWDRLWGWL